MADVMHINCRLEGSMVSLEVFSDPVGETWLVCPRCNWRKNHGTDPYLTQLLVGALDHIECNPRELEGVKG